MREIDNNMNSVSFKSFQQIPAQEEPTAEVSPAPAAETKEINDLSAMPSATLGKSQVSSDSIESDMKFMEKNPALAATLNDAIDKYAQTHTEEETIQMIEKAHQEFVSKK